MNDLIAIWGVTPFGFVALLTVHLHLRSNGRRQKRLEAALALVAEAHSGDVQKHRDLGEALAAAQLEEAHR